MPTFGVISPDHYHWNAVSIHNEGAKVIQITVREMADKALKHAAKRLPRGVIPTEGATCHGEAPRAKPEATERRDL